MTGSAGSIIASLFQGFGTNCFIFVLTLVIALPLGLIVCFGSMSKFLPLRWLTKTFVWIIRGTPLMLQLFVVMYAPGILFDTPMQSRMGAVMIAFVVNYAAYFSEIYRGGTSNRPERTCRPEWKAFRIISSSIKRECPNNTGAICRW